MLRSLSNKVKKSWADMALISIELFIVLVVFILALVVFILLTRHIFILKNENFDFRVFDYLQTLVSPRNNQIMLFLTYLGKHNFLIPANITLIVFFLFVKKHRWYTIKIPIIALSSLALMFILKNLFARPRPEIPLLDEARGLSFPSGHALMSVTFYGLLIYISWKMVERKWLKWTLMIFFLLLIFLIGFSRIYLRVHYASDVLAGFAIGFLWLVTSLWLLQRMEKYSTRKMGTSVGELPITDSAST